MAVRDHSEVMRTDQRIDQADEVGQVASYRHLADVERGRGVADQDLAHLVETLA